MINRDNFHDVKKYLNHLKIRQLGPESLRVIWSRLRHSLEWADDIPFPKAPSIRPPLPEYLLSARNDDRNGQLSVAYLKRVCSETRRFFSWGRRSDPRRYRHQTITDDWIHSLRIPREAVESVEPSEPQVFTLEDVRKVLALPARTLTERRDIAAVAFLFPSGMRADAFVSMPIKAVDIAEREVKQWPAWGVRTKGRKSETTYLLGIPDLLAVVSEWDALVRSELPPDAPWYALINGEGTGFAENQEPGKSRDSNLRRRMKRLCARAGLPEYSPHALRRGHTVYAMDRAQDPSYVLAVSQNLMHKNTTITELYAKQLSGDRKKKIRDLGTEKDAVTQLDTAIRSMNDAVARMDTMMQSMGTVAQLDTMARLMRSVFVNEGIPEPQAKQLIERIMAKFSAEACTLSSTM